jgi:hypothetical protein
MKQMKSLILRGGKFSFFLLMIVSVPILLETDILLRIWLKNVPPYANILTKLVIIFSLTDCFTLTMSMAIQATGKIKYYQLIVGGVLLLIFPISYLCYKLGTGPSSALIVSVIISIIAIFIRLIFIEKYLKIKKIEYIKDVFLVVVVVFITAIIPPFLCRLYMQEGFFRFVTVGITSLFSSIFFIYRLGLTVVERKQVNVIFRQKILLRLEKRK